MDVNDPYTVIPQYTEGDLQRRRSGLAARWIKPGEIVKIAGYTIRCGNFYLGDFLGGRFCDANDNPVVNPQIVDKWASDQVAFPQEPPSFYTLSPRMRRQYLEWLQGGASSKYVPVEFALIYFYGLEYRLMVDKPSEFQYLLGEIRRIYNMFGYEARLKRDVTRLMMALGVSKLKEGGRPAYDDLMERAIQPSPEVLIYLGRKIHQGRPLDADDLWLWAKASFLIVFHLPARRCPEHFEALFKVRFAQKYPTGLKVGMSRTPLRLHYRLATWRLAVPLEMPSHAAFVADVRQIPSILDEIKRMFVDCTQELELFSRYVGRKPLDAASLEAISLLPDALQNEQFAGELSKAVKLIKDGLQKANYLSTSGEKFLELLQQPLNGATSIPNKLHMQVSRFLDNQGYGFEPDKRFGSFDIKPTSSVCLFSIRESEGASDLYRKIRMVIEVGVLALVTNGRVTLDGIEALKNKIKESPGLKPEEFKRLTAFCKVAVKGELNTSTLLKAISKVEEEIWQSAAEFGSKMICVNGEPSKEGVKFMEKLFKARKLAANDCHSLIFRNIGTSHVAEDGLVRVAKASLGEKGTPIGPPTDNPEPENEQVDDQVVRIDLEKLQQLKRETAEVSGMLAEIFQDEEEPTVAKHVAQVLEAQHHNRPVQVGLDDKHLALLRHILHLGVIDQTSFTDVAKSYGLLPQGAIDTLNEWGFEQFDDPIISDIGGVAIETDCLGRITELLG